MLLDCANRGKGRDAARDRRHSDKANPSLPSTHRSDAASRRRSNAHDQVLRPDRRLRCVRTDGIRHVEPSRANRRLIGATLALSRDRLLTALYGLIAAAAVILAPDLECSNLSRPDR